MATGTIILNPAAATLGDGSTGNVPPATLRLKGTQTNQNLHKIVLAYDGAGAVIESAYWSFVLPADYVSGGSLVINGTVNSVTAGNVVMQARVSAVTPADADTPLEHAFSTAATVTIAVNTTEARRLLSGTITLNMDSAAARDEVAIMIFRDPANASDTSLIDFELWDAAFEYTT